MNTTVLDRFTGSVVADLGKQPCDCATTGNITLSGYQTVDGVVLNQDHMRVLVKNQTDATTNGIYWVFSDTWLRTGDFRGPSGTVNGQLINVTGGSQVGLWELTTPNPVQIDQSGGQSTPPSNITFQAFTFSQNTVSAVDPGFASFVIPPLAAPAIVLGNNLVGSYPAGQAVMRNPNTGVNQLVPIPAITNVTFPDNSQIDYFLNPPGSTSPWTVHTIALDNYVNAIREPNLIRVWSISTSGGQITANYMTSRLRPVVPRTTNLFRVADQIPVLYSIGQGTYTPMAFSSGMALTYGQVFYTPAGQMYQCFTKPGGNAGTVAPTFTSGGLQPFGSIMIGFYGDTSFIGGARYSLNGGIQNYFSSLMAQSYCDIQGTSGTQYSATAKTYIKNVLKHVITPRQSSATYKYGQKITGGGYIWLNITPGSNATASSSPFSGSYTVNTASNPFNGSQVTDGSITWLCIYISYASQQYMWMETDPTMYIYRYSDAHDSEATGLFDLIGNSYLAANPTDWQWMLGASEIPGQTYAQLLQNIYYYNLGFLYNGLTPTFQGNIFPLDGSTFSTQYYEDNTQSYAGAIGAEKVFTLLNNPTYASLAAGLAVSVDNALAGMADFTNDVVSWYYGDPRSWYGNVNVQWYPVLQAQFFAEFYQLPFADDAFKQGAMAYVTQIWNTWQEDPGPTPGLPLAQMALQAIKYWQNPEMAIAMINIIENEFLQNGLIASDFGFYLQIKKLLVPNTRIIKIDGVKVTYEDAEQNTYTTNARRFISTSGAATISAFYGDVVLNCSLGGALTLDLPIRSTLPDGYPIKVKDIAGNFGTNHVTVTPDGGSIDGSSTVTLSSNFGVSKFVYDQFQNQWYTD